MPRLFDPKTIQQYVTSTGKVKNMTASVGLFLAKNNWGILQMRWTQIAREVIPLSPSRFCAKHVSALLTETVWLPTCPSSIASRQWSTISPVELIVAFAYKSKPRTPGCNSFLLLHQVEDEVVFSG